MLPHIPPILIVICCPFSHPKSYFKCFFISCTPFLTFLTQLQNIEKTQEKSIIWTMGYWMFLLLSCYMILKISYDRSDCFSNELQYLQYYNIISHFWIDVWLLHAFNLFAKNGNMICHTFFCCSLFDTHSIVSVY